MIFQPRGIKSLKFWTFTVTIISVQTDYNVYHDPPTKKRLIKIIQTNKTVQAYSPATPSNTSNKYHNKLSFDSESPAQLVHPFFANLRDFSWVILVCLLNIKNINISCNVLYFLLLIVNLKGCILLLLQVTICQDQQIQHFCLHLCNLDAWRVCPFTCFSKLYTYHCFRSVWQ